MLARYAGWIMSFDGVGFTPINAHSPIVAHLADVRRRDKGYRLSLDGVHMDPSGHLFLAQSILEAWKVPMAVDEAAIDARSLTSSRGEVTNLKAEAGGIRFDWTHPHPHAARPGMERPGRGDVKIDAQVTAIA